MLKFKDGKFYPREHKYTTESKPNTEANKIRHTNTWKETSVRIRERDNYLCQACLHNLKGTARRYEHADLSVHHIIPIKINSSLAYEDSNLITLCSMHHSMAENGDISAATLMELIKGNSNW